jgi:hypothetical protein
MSSLPSKLLAFLALIHHWFNPLMWLCFALMSRDMEMSCDESVLHRLGEGAKGSYSGSLLSLAVKRKGLLAVNPLAFGESYVKVRIKNVLNFKKPAFGAIVVAVVAVCSAVIAFTANPFKEGTISAEDKRKLADVVSEYYLKTDPANKGTHRIYNIKKYGSGYLVLTEKYRGEGESFSVLFLVNHDFSIVAKAQGNMPISPCFSTNVVKDQHKSIVYGNFKSKKWEPKTDTLVNVQIDSIKITFEDGTIIKEAVSMEKGYIIVADTIAKIKNIEVYNNRGELQSDLNDSFFSEYGFIKVENETVSQQEEENDSNTIPMPDAMTDEEQKALQVVKEYFGAFGEADYDKMRTLATENHNRNLVHNGDVWGMKWAKAKQIELIRDPRFLGVENSKSILVFNVSVDMETVKTSAQYPATQTSFYVVLIKGDDGSWRVDRYTTG